MGPRQVDLPGLPQRDGRNELGMSERDSERSASLPTLPALTTNLAVSFQSFLYITYHIEPYHTVTSNSVWS